MLPFGDPPVHSSDVSQSPHTCLPWLSFIVDEAGSKQSLVWVQDRGGSSSAKIRLAQNFSSPPGGCNFRQLLHRDPFPAGAQRVSVAPYAHRVVGYRDRVPQ